MDDQRRFIDAVLPTDGFYCVLSIKEGKSIQEFFETVDEFLSATSRRVDEGRETYFGCAKFETNKSRKAENAKLLKAFWLDIDCGETKPYLTQTDALLALDKFLAATNLPQPYKINSGNGLHVYWPLDYEIVPKDWKDTATLLQALCLEQKLKVDGAIATNAAQILRLPGTINGKHGRPVVVTVMAEGKPTDPDEFKRIIEAKCAFQPQDNELGFAVPDYVQMDSTTKDLLGNKISNFATILKKSKAGDGCNQILSLYKNQKTTNYNMWRAGLSIAVNCEDSDTAIIAISHEYDGYDPYKTEQKARTCLDKPQLCATFESINPDGCVGCKYKGRITSPIQLGSRVVEARPEDNIVKITSEALQEEQIIAIPKYPPPYFRGKTGGVYMRVKSKDPEEADGELPIHGHDFYLTKRIFDPEKGECVMFRLHLPKDGMREALCPLSKLAAKDKISTFLAEQGLLTRNVDGVMAYLKAWSDHLQDTTTAEKTRQQFGWQDNNTRFVIGTREISGSGTYFSPPSSSTENIVPYYEKRGTISEWTEMVDIYGAAGNEPRAFTLFASFGSPLLKFTGKEGVLIHLVNKGSGVGKTTLQEVALSVWGDPKASMVNARDTAASRITRMTRLGNIPMCVDETSNMTKEEASEMTFAMTQGREKGRSQASVNAERANNLRWSLIAITSGNSSLRDLLKENGSSAEGELMRLIELPIADADGLDKRYTDRMFKRLPRNFGVAGEIYIKHVINNLVYAQDLVNDIEDKLSTAAGLSNKERFWSAAVASGLAGGQISFELGLHHIPPKNIFKWAVNMLKESILDNRLSSQDNDAISVIQRYIHENINYMLVINYNIDNRSGGYVVAPIKEFRDHLNIRYEPDTKMLFLVSGPFLAWCSKNRIPTKALQKELTDLKIFVKDERKVISKGVTGMSMNIRSWYIKWEQGVDIGETNVVDGVVKSIEKSDTESAVLH